MTIDQVEFATYCIGNLARALNTDEKTVYQKLRNSGILYDYIIGAYDVLHTFGKRYLMEDIIGLMKEKGVA